MPLESRSNLSGIIFDVVPKSSVREEIVHGEEGIILQTNARNYFHYVLFVHLSGCTESKLVDEGSDRRTARKCVTADLAVL